MTKQPTFSAARSEMFALSDATDVWIALWACRDDDVRRKAEVGADVTRVHFRCEDGVSRRRVTSALALLRKLGWATKNPLGLWEPNPTGKPLTTRINP